MKRNSVLIAVLLALTAMAGLTGCYGSNPVSGSQKLDTREYDNTGFDRVEVSSPIRVDLTRADTFRVSITANENIFNYIEVTQNGSILRVRLKPFFSFHNITTNVTITMPNLRALTLSGASSGEVAGFRSTGSIDLEVSGASRLDIVSLEAQELGIKVSGASRATGTVKASDANFELSGASRLEVDGSADGASMEGSGASSFQMANFYMLVATINLSGASNGNVEVNGRLDLELSGASHLTVGGDPILGNIQISGASSLSRR